MFKILLLSTYILKDAAECKALCTIVCTASVNKQTWLACLYFFIAFRPHKMSWHGNSCREWLKSGDNLSVLNLPHWNTRRKSLFPWKRWGNRFRSLPLLSSSTPINCAMLSSHRNARSILGPHSTLLEGWIFKLHFHMLPFNIRSPNFCNGDH